MCIFNLYQSQIITLSEMLSSKCVGKADFQIFYMQIFCWGEPERVQHTSERFSGEMWLSIENHIKLRKIHNVVYRFAKYGLYGEP